MLVEYDVIHVPDRGKEYRGVTVKAFCCDSMQSAYGASVRFSSFDDFGMAGARLVIAECRPYPDDPVYIDYEIDFCPFCGEAIVMKVRAQYDRVYHKKMETTEKTYTEEIVRGENDV